MESANEIIDSTKEWIEIFVIKHKICPFAAIPMKEKSVEFSLALGKKSSDWLVELHNMLNYLISHPISNAFLIFSEDLQDFDRYLEFFYVAESYLDECKFNLDFQIASFHPHFQFADYAKEDKRNYTNRSPYPMIHILRVSEVEDAIRQYGDTTKISSINEEKMKSLFKKKS